MNKVQTIDELLTILKGCRQGLTERFGVTDLAVFGSFVNGKQSRRSDIDILIELDKSHNTCATHLTVPGLI